MRRADALHYGAIKRLTGRFPGLSQSLTLLAAYTGWILVFRFVAVAFVTYFVFSSATGAGGGMGGSEGSRFEDVNEALGSGQLALMAICALGFIFLLRLFQPYTAATTEEIFTPQRFESRFLPGFLHGAVLATGVTLAFLLSGIYRYLGFFVQTNRAPLALASIALRAGSILVLVYCEEFVFRARILRALARRGGIRNVNLEGQFWHNLSATGFTGALFVGVKCLQFDLSWMQALTLFLVSMALGLRTLSNGDFALGAGFWAALLVVFHSLLSLPILGQDFSGLVLIKYQALAPDPGAEFWSADGSFGETMRFLTGGAGGPLASFVFQLLMIFDILRGALRYRRRLSRAVA